MTTLHTLRDLYESRVKQQFVPAAKIDKPAENFSKGDHVLVHAVAVAGSGSSAQPGALRHGTIEGSMSGTHHVIRMHDNGKLAYVRMGAGNVSPANNPSKGWYADIDKKDKK